MSATCSSTSAWWCPRKRSPRSKSSGHCRKRSGRRARSSRHGWPLPPLARRRGPSVALRIEDVIRRPIITEKNTWLMESSQYTFEVDLTANKIQIKEAVETTFSVRVLAVNTLVVKPKKKSRVASRRGGRVNGATASWKKAIVTLDPNDQIDLFEQV